MKNSLILFFCFLSIQILSGQCEQELWVLSNQNEVNNFFSNTGCTNLIGNLSIVGNDIVSLEPLANLETISGDLIIESTALTQLQGMENLNAIGGFLDIHENNDLLSIAGFSNLQSIGANVTSGGLKINSNSQLIHLEGFNQVNKFFGSIDIFENPNLESIDGFASLESIQINFKIERNNSLIEISGFELLNKVENHLTIAENPNLQSLHFPNLLEVFGVLQVRENNSLENMAGFLQLESIGERMSIDSTWSNLTGLDNLSFVRDLEFHSTNYESIENLLPNLSEASLISIKSNPLLQKIEGFEQLNLVQDLIIINNNPVLDTIKGFNKLHAINRFTSANNGALKIITGFDNLQIAENFYIANNPRLRSIPQFEGLTTLGWLRILDNGYLNKLEGFSNVIEAERIILQTSNIDTIKAFANAETIDWLEIRLNDRLKGLSGFSNLKQLGTLRIANNHSLTNIDDFRNLETLSELSISSNPSLQKINAFEQLKSLNQLSIGSSERLKEIDGFPNITQLSSLSISKNDSLQNIANFLNVDSIGYFSIFNNPLLEKIEGFDKAIKIGYLSITYNPLLEYLPELPLLKFIQYDLNIQHNESLSTCCPILCWKELTQGEIILEGNPLNCNQLSEIEQNCMGQPCNFSLEEPLHLINASPIPANSDLTITMASLSPFSHPLIADRLQYEIWNVKGQLIPITAPPLGFNIRLGDDPSLFDMKTYLEMTIQVNVQNYLKGIYFLKIIDLENGEELVVRFIKD